MEKETFGQRLSRLRKQSELTQSDIADRLGVTPQAVSKWENDQASPDIDILIRLSDIFSISVDELLGKQRPVAVVAEKKSEKELEKLVFRIEVKSEDGDTVNVNLPLALVKVFVNAEDGKVNMLSGNKNLENIDFRELIALAEKGLMGELVSIDAADGSKVRVKIE